MQQLSLTPTYLKDPGPYLVEMAVEIDHLLQHLLQQRSLICLYPSGKREPVVVSVLLGVEADQLYLDASPEDGNNQLLQKHGLTVVCQLRGVKHQFDSTEVTLVDFEQHQALVIPRPRQMLRLQRRRSYRLTLPLGAPVPCTLEELGVTLPIADLSQEGLGLVAEAPLALQPGQTLEDVHFTLPDGKRINPKLRLQSITEVMRKVGPPAVHYGFHMVALDPVEQRAVQRYLVQLERQRLELER